ncbi:spore germination protein [Tenuibacillus multivorans]|uniref:Spore germination protein PA n=1 Tax=Tenuibacillus multivorans TaxID=237069 RepID=A0A1H0A1Z5_9BACI|nr:spore germination protein [Tenuibacillus multivorans]GEL78347.1 putative spore germination protein GerPA [Tenuibacillus multivorans]SDN26963.1 spore germination protein PA [Tenuibacillus multivorans]
MPAFVGAIKVNAVSSSAVFHIGDTYYIQPISTAKTYAGGGSFNTGDGIRVQLDYSDTIVFDQDQIDY